MTIRVGESGDDFLYGTTIDLSTNTELTLRFTGPSGSNITFDRTTADGVTAPNSDSPPTNEGILPADTYMKYTYNALDFTVKGDWIVCSIYDDTGPAIDVVRKGPDKTFEVLAGC